MEEKNNQEISNEVQLVTEMLEKLFQDNFYTLAKMEGYMSKAGDIQETAKEAINEYKEKNGIPAEVQLNSQQIEEIGIEFDQEMKKSIEMDRDMVKKGKLPPADKRDSDIEEQTQDDESR